MSRRQGILSTRAQMQRDVARQHTAHLRAETQAMRTALQAQRAYERAQYAEQRERTRLYAESRIAKVALMNEVLEQTVADLRNLLSDALLVRNHIDLQTLKHEPAITPFDPGSLGIPISPPLPYETYSPSPLGGVKRFLPGAKEQFERDVTAATQRYHADMAAYHASETRRQSDLSQAWSRYEREIAEIHAGVQAQHAEIDAFQTELLANNPSAVVDYFTLVLSSSIYPNGFPETAKIAYTPESKQLVIERDMPTYEVVPEMSLYKYVKVRDEISTSQRTLSNRKAIYSGIVAQMCLRTIHEVFESDRYGHVETIVFNGYVDAIDKATGRPSRVCLITARTTREAFGIIDLSRVDPVACLRALNAAVSKSPEELAPVRPVLEFSMVDPRFIEETDVLSGLDQRPNLMEITPSEFEALISNLFERMGLDTRLTQASRDGGVDCVAYDPRPIFGGKVVIQAKRYKHTVGVSAVRDLFGTVQNEGASKGILVTTSGYGKAAFDFAGGKPLELLDGSNLLYLLAEHAQIEAKIEMPVNWKDPEIDSAIYG